MPERPPASVAARRSAHCLGISNGLQPDQPPSPKELAHMEQLKVIDKARENLPKLGRRLTSVIEQSWLKQAAER